MGAHCCGNHQSTPVLTDRRQRRVLWVVQVINIVMFGVEIVAGHTARSASLQADALDFLADAANYGISLFVVGTALTWRARAALVKGLSMGVFGLWVVGATAWNAIAGTVPEAPIMGAIGLLALLANALLASTGFRRGDANMRSVWICSRNDVLANLAVLLAALGVFGTGTGWPDIIVAGIMARLALYGAGQVVRQALAELREGTAPAPAQ
ncbi:MAG: cation transporter [Rhodovibrio sp.]|nr:cation transporter [Rhodovibrio sp.]